MKSVEDALANILAHARLTAGERVPLGDALGRYLSDDLRAAMNHPPFDQSAMDGWAVRSADVAEATREAPVRLRIAGESRAGGGSVPAAPAGDATRIFTGAPLPAGADAVVIQEDARVEGAQVLLEFAAAPSHHVRGKGKSRSIGSLLAPAGTRVDAGVVAVAASEGQTALDVRKRPTVSIITTGDEVQEPGRALADGCIYNSNGAMLGALVSSLGGRTASVQHAADDLDTLCATLQGALGSDLVISAGGASVGDHDHVRDAMTRCGLTMQFWKIAVKPGKPVAFGISSGGVPVLALPGNPVSAFVTFHLFVAPLLGRMVGAPARPLLRVVLDRPISHRRGREEYVRCRLARTHPTLTVSPFAQQNSGAMHDLALADALVRLPADVESFPAGTELDALFVRSAFPEP